MYKEAYTPWKWQPKLKRIANDLDMDFFSTPFDPSAVEFLEEDVSILDLRFVKPLDENILKNLATKHKKWFVFSDSSKAGGVGSAILEFLAKEKILDIELTSFEYEDEFITHGNTKLVEESLGLLPKQLAVKVKESL